MHLAILADYFIGGINPNPITRIDLDKYIISDVEEITMRLGTFLFNYKRRFTSLHKTSDQFWTDFTRKSNLNDWR